MHSEVAAGAVFPPPSEPGPGGTVLRLGDSPGLGKGRVRGKLGSTQSFSGYERTVSACGRLLGLLWGPHLKPPA